MKRLKMMLPLLIAITMQSNAGTDLSTTELTVEGITVPENMEQILNNMFQSGGSAEEFFIIIPPNDIWGP